MRAAVVHGPGNPDVLELTEVPKPEARSGWVLIQVMAFGLNRSEIFTRQGHSGSAVTFPRILGIECVGVVEAAPESPLEAGQKVATVMGGMGRAYDGSYAEYTLVPAAQVMPVIDNGNISKAVREIFPAGVTHVLELIGPATLLDSLKTAAPRGVVCNTGILGNTWVLQEFEPMAAIPSSVHLTTFLSETVDASTSTSELQKVLDAASQGRYRPNPHRVFRLDEIVEAHRYMEANQATGEIVIKVSEASTDA